MYDFIVIGSGYGGLAIASLLAKEGYRVLILESHIAIAGCASFLKRKDFLFDVGATTFSGVRSNQPLGILFNNLNIKSKLQKVDPGLIIKNINGNIIRHAGKEAWIEEASRVFNSSNQKKFWEKIFKIDSTAWEFSRNNYKLPPQTFGDYMSAVKPSNLKAIGLLPAFFQNVQHAIEKYNVAGNRNFLKFLDEQLLITTQNTRFEAPFLTSAMGLAYPSETYYPYGGMYKPADLIKNRFLEFGGEILFKQTVTDIKQSNDGYKITTDKGKAYLSKSVVSNIPIWNMAKITHGKIRQYFSRQADYFDSAWGAFVLNFAIETNVDLPTTYYQIHTDKQIPYCNALSFFVTFSMKDDIERAPKGWKTITISTHTDVDNWLNISKDEYAKRKSAATEFILQQFDKSFPELKDSAKMYLLTATPETFEFFTNRHKGFVGGIPHSIKKSILKMPPNQTPFKNLYMVGDTVFPGQGTPAVIQGALNVFKRITD